MTCIVRSYRPSDREAVRTICCDTGFHGNPIDPVFGDRETFADFFTRYYTDREPESCLVAVADGAVVGYLCGCVHFARFAAFRATLTAMLTPRIAVRIVCGRYRGVDRDFIRWVVFRGWRETPDIPPRSAHFHINMLPAWRRTEPARTLIFTFLDSLPQRGAVRVYGQIRTFANRRSDRLFERYGFRLYDRKTLTRFRAFDSRDLFVSTFFKTLEA